MRPILGVLLSLTALIAREPPSRASGGTGVVTGIVVDETDGHVVADVAVGVRNCCEVLFPGKTGTDGRFRISDVKPGTYFLDARKAGYVTYYVEPPMLFEVRAEATVELLPIRLTATATISGGVVDPWGAPIKGAHVALTTAEQTEIAARVRMYRATTDAAGGFTIPEVKPGRYFVEATAKNRYGGDFVVQVASKDRSAEWRQATYSTVYWKTQGTPEQWSELNVGPRAKVGDLQLQLGWNVGQQVRPSIELGDSGISVRTIDQTTRKPVPHAQVALWRLPAARAGGAPAPIITTLADDSGVVSFTGLASGEYEFYVERIGYASSSFKVRSTETIVTPVLLELAPAGVPR